MQGCWGSELLEDKGADTKGLVSARKSCEHWKIYMTVHPELLAGTSSWYAAGDVVYNKPEKNEVKRICDVNFLR